MQSSTANLDRLAGLGELQSGVAASASAVTVAVIDGDADLAHPVFAGALLASHAGVLPARFIAAGRTHGTQIASILFGQPGSPLVGIAPDCRGLLVPVFADDGEGGIRPCSEIDLARAIHAAIDAGVQVINISAGRRSAPGTAGMHLAEAVERAIAAGIVVVAAAGNDGCACLQVPAALSGVLVVGGCDRDGRPGAFSNFGSAYAGRGVLAPGTDVLAAEPGGGLVGLSGTSFATPFVSGLAALLAARLIGQGEPPDGRRIVRAILAGADRCDPAIENSCDRFLAGIVNVRSAEQALLTSAASLAQSTLTDRKEGISIMEREPMNAGAHGAPDPMQSIHAMAEALRAMQGTMAELGRSLGGIRPAGPVADSPVAPMPAVLRRDPPVSARDGDRVEPAACCDACAAREARQLVFALGKVGYDFGTEARYDSIQSQLQSRLGVDGRLHSVGEPLDLVAFLRLAPEVSPAITWTLTLDETPIYAIRPEGDYLEETYKQLVDTLEAQATSAAAVEAAASGSSGEPASGRKGRAASAEIPPPAVERMSLPGVINGKVTLMSGLVIPTVRPALGAMYRWSTDALVDALDKRSTAGVANDPGKEGAFNPRDGLRTFLTRIYEELRNTGLAPQDRALNFAATNAYQAMDVFVKIRGRNIHIEKFEAVRSPVMRPDADLWDVKMTFYDPAAPTTKPREVYFYTIDVSDVVPVAIGKARHWTTY